jgi:hypothetical protein
MKIWRKKNNSRAHKRVDKKLRTREDDIKGFLSDIEKIKIDC